MLRLRPVIAFLTIALALCLLGLWRARSQVGSLRRVTTTTEDGINVNPSLSGDGRRVAFESTEDIAHAGGSNLFRAIRAELGTDPATFAQIGATRAPAPGISQDGSRLAFAAKENPLGTNPDGNSEIFFYDGSALRQVTNTTPSTPSERTRQGNFQPSLTDDGRFIAFSSNRNLANQNSDGNLEIFVYDTTSNTFAQLTNTTGPVGASDAKISGDGSRVAYIRDASSLPAVQRDLILQDRTGGTTRIIAANVTNLAMTYGRAISDDGTRVVFSGDVAANSSQVFIFDGRTTNASRQITALGVRETEVPLHPTISGDGTRLAFATRRPIPTFANTDNSIELYTYDIPTGQFARVTSAPTNADGFDGSNRAAEVVSSLSDDGAIVAFNFPRSLSGTVTSGTENNSEIYVTGTAPRPTVGALTILNEASMGNEPATTKAVAPDSSAAALGGALAFTTEQAAKPPAGGSYPTTLGGTIVTVNGRRAQISFVSPTQVNFIVPPATELGTAEVVVTNSEGFQSRGTVLVVNAAPGIYTLSGDGLGEGMVLDADKLTPGPFDPSNGNLRLVIFTTGVRHATQVTATAGGRALTVESFLASPDLPGLDEVRVLVPADLRGAGTVNLVVRADTRDSNPVTIIFSGNACRDIVINEVLADPPDGAQGDANRDGTRSGSDDEFVELVNTTSNNINIGGYQLLTRSSTAATDTVRHTFAPGTLFPAGSAIVIFGGGEPTFNPNDVAFGGAQVFKASSGGLSLTNTGGVVTLREPSQAIVNIFSYGGSTGLNGDANQSLTRFPDAAANNCGSFTLHTTPPESGGRLFSPGRRVDGTPFAAGVGQLTSVSISPPSATIPLGQTAQFTAQARDQFNRPLTNVTITFVSDNTGVATVDGVTTDPSTGIATATVTGRAVGTAHITAQATDGTTTVTSPQATLTVNPLPAVVTRVDVSPATPTINRGQTQQFTATAFDQNSQPISGASFAWSSSNTNVATIDPNGLATGVGPGSTTITATTSDATGTTVSGTATLTVQVPLVINEILADPADGISGDSNRDGARDADDDEFVELVNNSSAPVDVSGVVVADSTSNRFTFPANTTLAAGRAVVIFGGGTPPAGDPAFGGALIFTTSSLSLGNTGDTVIVKLPIGGSDVLIASQTYGAEGGDNQSLTRSPDLTGSFVKHTAATNADGRIHSPGTRVDGTPFGSPPITRIEVSPSSAAVSIGQTQGFTAKAFSNTGGPEVEVPNVSFIWDSSDPSKATVSPSTGVTTTATALASGSTTIRARAGGQLGMATLTVNPTISINDVTLNEGNSGTTTFTFTVSLSAPASSAVTFNIATADGTATVADNDYVARSLTSQTIPAGQQTYTFDVTVNGDTNIEPNETFLTNITNVIGATVGDGQGTGTILNDDSPALSINDVVKNEGNSGTTTFTFTVSLTLPAQAGGVTFDIATADGAATAGSDYVARTLTSQTIPTGQQTYTFDVTVNGDTALEPDETFLVNVTNVTGASVNDAQGQGTITNDDASGLVISQVYGGGNNTGAQFRNDFIEIFNRGTTTVDFSVTPFSVQYASVGSNFGSSKTNLTSGAIAPGHYFLVQESGGTTNGVALPTPDATGTINLAATSGKVALVVGTNFLSAAACPGDDGLSPFNPTDSTVVDFVGYGSAVTTTGHCYEGSGPAPAPSNTTADFRKAAGCVDTNDNAADFLVSTPNPRNVSSPANDCSAGIKPEITINDVTVTEGDTGTKTVDFTVTLSASSTLTITVDYATADGTATAGSDYQSTSGQLTFTPGDITKTVTVTINGDTLDETNETFFVNLSNATNATILDGQGQGTITDNDPQPSLSINDVSVAEGDSGTTNANFTVTLSTASGQTVTVNYATADGTATAGSDYQAASGSVTFNPGQTTQTVTVPVTGDTTFEQNETFFVNLSGATNATISDTQGQGTITNDDAAPPTPSLSINDVSVAEGDSGTKTLTFTVTLSPTSTDTVTVDYATADGTATAGSDYQSASGQLTFNPGDGTKNVSVTINGDTLVETDETFFVNLSNAANATIIDSQGIGTITNDDTPLLVISQVYGGGNNSGATYQNDFIEIFNRGTTTVDFSVTPFSVQYAGVGSNFGSSKTNLTTGTLSPGRYFLIQESGGTTNGVPLPTPDATGAIAMGNTSGKVALVAGTNFLSATACPGDDGASPFNPADSTVVDFVGYGNTAGTSGHCYEGSGPAPAPSNTTADFRKASGCTDTNDNAADFLTATPSPRNTSSTLHNCSFPDLTINDVTVTEGNSGTTTATFTVSLSAPAPSTVTFDIATANNTATAGSDYVAKSLTSQTISAGQQTYTFDVTVNGDTDIESDETFFVNVTNVSGANVTDGQGQGSITNDDSAVLTINDVTANETNSGTTTFTFTVSSSLPAPAGGITFDIATADGTALAGSDYVAKSLTGQTIGVGQQTYTFDVTVNGDTLVEPNETFTVNLTNVTGAILSDGQGLGTITNDDTANLVISQLYQGGGLTNAIYKNDFIEIFNRGTTTVDFSLTPYSVQFLSTGAATWAKTDLTTGTIAPGQYFLIQESGGATGANLPTPDATGSLNLTSTTAGKVALVLGTTLLTGNCPGDDGTTPFNPVGSTVVDFVGYGGNASTTNHCYEGSGPASYTLSNNTIADFRKAGGCTDTNDNAADFFTSTPFPRNTSSAVNNCVVGTAPNLSINDVTAAEGNSGTTIFTFTVSLSAPAPSTDVFFDIATANNTATTANSDYVAKSLTNQVIPAGQQTYTFTVTVNGDTTLEPDETFFVNVTNVVGATPTDSQGVGTIQNDEAPSLTINDVTQSEGNAGTSTFTFTVSLSAAATSAVTFDIATQDNTATVADNDYVTKSLTSQTIPVGQQTYTFDVTVNGDTNVESNETFFVNVTNVSGAILSDGQGVGAIQNDDAAPPTLTINDVTMAEGNSGTTTFSFTVSLSAPAPSTVTFNIATQDNTATVADNDYVAKSLVGQTISTGQQTYTFDVTVNGDTNIESNESFFVNVTGVTGATLGDGQGVGTINNDDAVASSADLSITKVDTSDPVAIGNDITYTITATNGGPDTAVNAVLADTVPTNTTFRSIAPPVGWTCGTQPAVGGTGAISCTNPSFGVGSAVFTLVVRVNPSATDGTVISNTASVSSDTSDPTNNNSATQTTTVKQPLLVISQIYPGGGLTNAAFTNDFIEIFNRGTTTVDFAVTPYSVQFLSTGAATWAKTDLTSGKIEPGQYFLIQGASGGAVGSTLPTPDATGTLNLTSTTAGKVALVLGTTLLTGNCPGDDGTTPFNPVNSTVVDFVGYGGNASTVNHCYEGTGPAPFSTSTDQNRRSTIRTSSCTDTNNNSADFTNPTNPTGATPPTPRNTATAKTPCP